MLPIVEIFGKEIPMYAVFAIIGMLVAGFAFCRYVDRCGFDNNYAILFLLAAAVGVIIGGHTLYAITNIDKFYLFREKDFLSAVGTVFGGSVFYGGLIGACGAGLIFMKMCKVPRRVYMDGCAFLAPLFHAFARVGCFFAGCCYGIESDFGFVAHNNTLTDIGNVRRFPVQLLEAVENLLIVLLIVILLKKKKQRGNLFYIYLISYSSVRFVNEFLRGDEIRGFILGMSTSQFISIIIFALSVTLLIINNVKRHKKKQGFD